MEPAIKHRKLSSVFCVDLDGWDGAREEEGLRARDICIHIADSLHCTAGTNKIL